MPLHINNISLRDFRSYSELDLTLDPGVSVVVGPNAVGKTNLIEALQLVTAGESFRRPRWSEVIREGSQSARVVMRAEDADTTLDVSLLIEPRRRSYTINEKKKRPIDLLGRMPCVVFTPDDLFMIKGPAEERRRTVDETGDQLSSTYARLRSSYARVLKQRNTALKAGADGAQVSVYDEQLVDYGAKLMTHRTRLVDRLAQRAAGLYEGMAQGEELSVRLRNSYGFDQYGAEADEATTRRELMRLLHDSAAEETARRTTVVGPHRDDLQFSINGREARTFASQGQQRSAALAWKLAEVGVIEDVIHRRPVLLLDDVMSELDRTRRLALMEMLSRTTQTIITTTNLQYFEPTEIDSVVVVELNQ